MSFVDKSGHSFVEKYSASAMPLNIHKRVVKYCVTDSMKRVNRIGNPVFFLDGVRFTLSRKLNRCLRYKKRMQIVRFPLVALKLQ